MTHDRDNHTDTGLHLNDVPDGGDCPDLDAIGCDLRTVAGILERLNAEGGSVSDDLPTIVADLAEAVERWAEVVA